MGDGNGGVVIVVMRRDGIEDEWVRVSVYGRLNMPPTHKSLIGSYCQQ